MITMEKETLKNLKSWPFQEAFKVVEKFGGFEKFCSPSKNYVLFETGYGPSGLPHIGTFGEVVRTTMVRNALEKIVNCKTKLITFSDDMDGLRKIPGNVPKKEMLEKYIGKPLTSIPDPFDKYQSFGHHNNAKLKSFLDQFNFEYEFMSSTEKYKSGDFDNVLIKILENYKEIISVILPTLRSERKETYSPFLPISPISGKVLQVKIDEYRPKNRSIIYTDPENNTKNEIEVIGGNCKLQWKVDWAMRWLSLDVDYEMCGKDLTESVILASKICKILGKDPPVNLIYEMFLDEKGEKISKSSGNGISVDQWLRYASPESLSLFMYQKPQSAKKLFFDIIPKSVDDYFSYLKKFNLNNKNKKITDNEVIISGYDNPVWHIHNGIVPDYNSDINFNSLLNLVSICNSTEKKIIWSFVNEYDPSINSKSNPEVDILIQFAINYYIDFVLPNKKYLQIDENNRIIFEDLYKLLISIDDNQSGEEIQTQIYEIGKKHNFLNLRDFFKLIYQVLLGQEQGPRLGSFVKLYGLNKIRNLLEEIIDKSK
tara:strand:- start:4510 stop:6132 length:1623 start_codon:yes stop_codon:yes gene_type:complete